MPTKVRPIEYPMRSLPIPDEGGKYDIRHDSSGDILAYLAATIVTGAHYPIRDNQLNEDYCTRSLTIAGRAFITTVDDSEWNLYLLVCRHYIREALADLPAYQRALGNGLVSS